MRLRLILIPLTLLLLIGGALWWTRSSPPQWTWKKATLERTDVRSVVTATGTLEAVTTVQVGTQVSGIVSERFVDYNDIVKKNQLLARIDPTLSRADIDAAQARLNSARASESRTRLEKERIQRLQEQGAATAQELEIALAEWNIDKAEEQSAQVALRRAQRNLSYTEILAPIDGVVVRRDIDIGQTVNAGFSAPTLFVLAGDLHQVQILASVDEADVGRVKEEQSVDITVPAYPGQTFAGQVQQVRLQSKLVDNVVTYPTVVTVQNPESKLRPGMTASLEFLVASAPNALCAPNAALRFRPEAEMLAPNEQLPEEKRSKNGPKTGTLWIAADDGLHPKTVEIGLRGSTCTEIKSEDITEGTELIIAAERQENSSTSPLSTGKNTNSFRGGGF